MQADRHSQVVLRDLAELVVAGGAVDWAEAESSAPPEQLSRLHQLERIARLVNGHKKSQRPVLETGGIIDPGGADIPRTTWGHLEILDKIGEGAFGEVLRAREPRLDRLVALKFFRPHRLSTSPLSSEVIEEGRLLARVRHPNVVTVYGAEDLEGRIGIWMEFIAGSTLEDIVARRGPRSTAEAIAIGQDLCRAVTALHKAGVIHRDIKARNVMRETGGRIVLMDLGISCEIDQQVPIKQYGTPLYAAPEVLRANVADFQTDVYSVGVLLFYLVTGQYPVAAATLAELSAAHEAGRYHKLKDLNPDLGGSFTDVVDNALAPDPELRFATAEELEQALTSALAAGRAEKGTFASSSGAEKADRGAKAYTPDQQAYNRYLQGLYFFARRYRGGDAAPKALDYFRQAISCDPDFAMPHVGVADCLNVMSYYQYLRPREGFPQARSAAERALSLDPGLGEAQASLGYICMYYDWDFAASENHFLRAIELKPHYILAHQWYAMLLSARGRHDEALARIQEGRELDPATLIINMEAMILLQSGQFEEAVQAFRVSLEAEPDSLWHLTNLGVALWSSGCADEALTTVEKAVQVSRGEDSLAMGLLACLLAWTGRANESLELIERLDLLEQRRYVSFFHRALPWLAMNRHDRWGPLLEKAIEERDPLLVWMHEGNAAAAWRPDPRFAEPLRKAGLLD